MSTASISRNPYFGNHSTAAAWKFLPTSITSVLFQTWRPTTVIHLTIRQQRNTHVFFPSLPAVTRTTADVFRLMFFFPSGVSVERQVIQGSLLGGAVKQFKDGIEDDVPVPRKMSSISGLVLFSIDGEVDSPSGIVTFPFVWVV